MARLRLPFTATLDEKNASFKFLRQHIEILLNIREDLNGIRYSIKEELYNHIPISMNSYLSSNIMISICMFPVLGSILFS